MGKIMSLSIKRVVCFFIKDRKLFILSVLGIAVTLFGMMYNGGKVLNSYYNGIYNQGMNVYFYLDVINNTKQNIADINTILGDNVQKISVLETADRGSNLINENGMVGEYVFDEDTGDRYIYAGRYFVENENKPVMVLCQSFEEKIGAKDTVDFDVTYEDKKYRVVGMRMVSEYPESYVVPLNYYLDNFNTNFINIKCHKYVTNDKKEKIVSYCKKNDIECEFGKKIGIFESGDFTSYIIRLGAIYGIAIIDFFIIVFYWNKKNKRYFEICRLLGMSKVKMLVNIIFSTGVLVLLSDAIACIAFAVLYDKLYIYELSSFIGIAEYACIVFIHLVICLVYSTYVAIRIIRNKQIYCVKGE